MREEQKAMAFSKQMTENLEHFKQILQTDKNFDVVYRVIDIAGAKGMSVLCRRIY